MQGWLLRAASGTKYTHPGEKPNCPLIHVPKSCNSIATTLSLTPSPRAPVQQFFFLLLKITGIESSETEAFFSEILNNRVETFTPAKGAQIMKTKCKAPWFGVRDSVTTVRGG